MKVKEPLRLGSSFPGLRRILSPLLSVGSPVSRIVPDH